MNTKPLPIDRFLILDTAMNGCGVAAQAGDRRSGHYEAMSSGQAERLMPMIGQVLTQAGLGYSDLQAVVTTCGPGAFTGLRMGLSTARALGLSLEIPVYGISTLRALVLQYFAAGGRRAPVGAILETKREDYYFQAFDAAGEAQDEPKALDGRSLAAALSLEHVLIGDGAERFMLAERGAWARAGDCVTIDPLGLASVFARPESRDRYFTQNVEPIYLRGPEVNVSSKEQRRLSV